MSDKPVELRVVHEPDDFDPFGCVIACHDHREPSVGEAIEWLSDKWGLDLAEFTIEALGNALEGG